MKYRISSNSRSGMHIVRKQSKKTRGLCGKPVGQEVFHYLPLGPLNQANDDEPLCAACFGHYANEHLLNQPAGEVNTND